MCSKYKPSSFQLRTILCQDGAERYDATCRQTVPRRTSTTVIATATHKHEPLASESCLSPHAQLGSYTILLPCHATPCHVSPTPKCRRTPALVLHRWPKAMLMALCAHTRIRVCAYTLLYCAVSGWTCGAVQIAQGVGRRKSNGLALGTTTTSDEHDDTSSH